MGRVTETEPTNLKQNLRKLVPFLAMPLKRDVSGNASQEGRFLGPN